METIEELTEEGRAILIEEKVSKFPNLEKDPGFSKEDIHFGDGARAMAIRQVKKAESSKEFPRAEIFYSMPEGGVGVFRKMVYIIGRGEMYYGKLDVRETLFFLTEWNQIPEYRGNNVDYVALKRIKELEFFE